MIRGFFDPKGVEPYPYVSVAVLIPGAMRRWRSVDFLVDTGAVRTCIHPRDAEHRLGIDPGRLTQRGAWPSVVQTGGIGGGAAYFDVAAAFGFESEDGSWDQVIASAWIAELTTTNTSIPSLLGWDLLQYFRIDLDGARRIITLERA